MDWILAHWREVAELIIAALVLIGGGKYAAVARKVRDELVTVIGESKLKNEDFKRIAVKRGFAAAGKALAKLGD